MKLKGFQVSTHLQFYGMINNVQASIKLYLQTLLLIIAIFIVLPSAFAQQRKSFIPRTIDWGYKIVQGDSAHPYKKYIFAVPIIAYRPESKWIFGLSVAHIFRSQYNDSLTRPSTIRVNVSYSQMKQFSVKPFFEYFTKGNKINIRAQYQYTNFSEYYWGIGPNTQELSKEMYAFNMHRGYVKMAYKLAKGFYAGIQYSFEDMYKLKYAFGSKLETSGYTGSNGYYASGVGFTFYKDNRDNIYFPYNGSFIEFSNVFYKSAFGSKYNFSNYTLDARKYLQLWKENILATQLYMNLNSGNIPFRMMGTLGSDVFMRGYYNGRYRDINAFAFQTELRKTIWGPIGCTLFAGFGSVNKSISDLTLNIKPNFGFGIRVKAIPRERLNMRMDYGFGSNGIHAFYLTLNEAF